MSYVAKARYPDLMFFFIDSGFNVKNTLKMHMTQRVSQTTGSEPRKSAVGLV